jgi:uncharacterized membrane protein
MSGYPQPVAAIAGDYLERVKARLGPVPAPERDEFLREIESHVYEAYQQTPGEDDVARILAVLRNLGDPAEVVADRLPAAMLRSGSKRNLPTYILGGLFLALFGIPIGAGGLGVLAGLLAALAGLLVAYFAVTGSLLLVSAVFMLLGLMRLAMPHLWDSLIAAGFIQMPAPFLDRVSAADQGFVMLVVGGIAGVAGLGLFWVGKRLFRGMRFLFTLFLDWTSRAARSVRRKLRDQHSQTNRAHEPASSNSSPGWSMTDPGSVLDHFSRTSPPAP